MTRKDLIEAVAIKCSIPIKSAAAVVNATFQIIRDELSVGNEVKALRFGKFGFKNRVAREGVNPRTREPIQIPARKVPTFTASKSFKEAVNR